MTVLKGYFDESGWETDPQCSVCGFAGYIGTCDQWKVFEQRWGDALQAYGLPWLHMNQFAHFQPPFERFKRDSKARIEFMQELFDAIEQSGISGIGHGVILDDLKRFNSETGLNIEASPFCISNAICGLADHLKYTRTQDDTIEAKCDYFYGANKTIGTAFDYLKHDPLYRDCDARIVAMSPTTQGQWMKVTPLQAADLLAYEAYKSTQSWAEWLKVRSPDDNLVDYLQWKFAQQPKREWHGERRSGIELAHSSALTTMLCDLDRIRELHKWRDGKWS
jgi:hypothetical protein